MSLVLLIMGLPGSGKTTLADATAERLRASCFAVLRINADVVRGLHADWDFSREGRIRQAQRLRAAAEAACADVVIMDFVAALPEQRDIVAPNVLVWMNTIAAGRYEDTNAAFVPPARADEIFSAHDPDNLDRVARLALSLLEVAHV